MIVGLDFGLMLMLWLERRKMSYRSMRGKKVRYLGEGCRGRMMEEGMEMGCRNRSARRSGSYRR
jgi:hypothetical protein